MKASTLPGLKYVPQAKLTDTGKTGPLAAYDAADDELIATTNGVLPPPTSAKAKSFLAPAVVGIQSDLRLSTVRVTTHLWLVTIDQQIAYDGRAFFLRGWDPFGVVPQRVYLEDAVSGEQIVHLAALVFPAEAATAPVCTA